MLDSHTDWHLPNWWIMPYIDLWLFKLDSYALFLFLWLIIGLAVFYYYVKKLRQKNDKSFFIIMAWLIWGIIWAKLPIWIAYWDSIKTWGISSFLSGRTVVGWLIWGILGVIITKHILKIKTRIWNAIAPWAVIGIAIWRIWCFLHGCCYGQSTTLPWWVNFGDWINRHPTQLYESFFLLIVFFFMVSKRKTDIKEGLLFDIFLIVYFSFRFLIEFIRVEPKVFYWFSLYQLSSIIVIIYVLFKMILLNWIKKQK